MCEEGRFDLTTLQKIPLTEYEIRNKKEIAELFRDCINMIETLNEGT